mmetsp:Transcript_23702/g.41991  ORF Transcript_23702/g.41991 Transcript_23702/m.41991 type:complete len:110 (-) Transcript_23702:2050-2379(-)
MLLRNKFCQSKLFGTRIVCPEERQRYTQALRKEFLDDMPQIIENEEYKDRSSRNLGLYNYIGHAYLGLLFSFTFIVAAVKSFPMPDKTEQVNDDIEEDVIKAFAKRARM